MIAASAGREQVVRLLIGRGGNLNTQNNGGHSALQYAASKNHHEVRTVWMHSTLHLYIHIPDCYLSRASLLLG